MGFVVDLTPLFLVSIMSLLLVFGLYCSPREDPYGTASQYEHRPPWRQRHRLPSSEDVANVSPSEGPPGAGGPVTSGSVPPRSSWNGGYSSRMSAA